MQLYGCLQPRKNFRINSISIQHKQKTSVRTGKSSFLARLRNYNEKKLIPAIKSGAAIKSEMKKLKSRARAPRTKEERKRERISTSWTGALMWLTTAELHWFSRGSCRWNRRRHSASMALHRASGACISSASRHRPPPELLFFQTIVYPRTQIALLDSSPESDCDLQSQARWTMPFPFHTMK